MAPFIKSPVAFKSWQHSLSSHFFFFLIVRYHQITFHPSGCQWQSQENWSLIHQPLVWVLTPPSLDARDTWGKRQGTTQTVKPSYKRFLMWLCLKLVLVDELSRIDQTCPYTTQEIHFVKVEALTVGLVERQTQSWLFLAVKVAEMIILANMLHAKGEYLSRGENWFFEASWSLLEYQESC